MTKTNVEKLRVGVRRANRHAFRPITTAEFFGVTHVAMKNYIAAGAKPDPENPQAFIEFLANYYRESRHDPQAA